jgi:hypothetical protein
MELFELIVREWLLGDVTIPTQVIMYNQCCSRRFSQSDYFIHSKLNHNCVDKSHQDVHVDRIMKSLNSDGQ